MNIGNATAGTAVAAGLVAACDLAIGAPEAHTRYEVECFGADGRLKWREEFDNLVVTAGLNKLLDATFKTGLASPAWYVGLKLTGTAVLADTMASHASWTESAAYAETTRQAFTPGSIAAGSVDNTASKAVFTMNATATITGCFLADNSTKSGTTGTLYGAGDFGTSRSVISGDILNVSVTPSVS